MGAEIIKLEPPGVGDAMRDWGRGVPVWWSVIARNKKSATLNLREPRGQQLLRDLVAHADILIENFRPGTMEKWGLGYAELAAINPRTDHGARIGLRSDRAVRRASRLRFGRRSDGRHPLCRG